MLRIKESESVQNVVMPDGAVCVWRGSVFTGVTLLIDRPPKSHHNP